MRRPAEPRPRTALAAVVLAAVGVTMAADTRAESTLRPFVHGSYGEILQSRAGRPFLLALWSVDCVPCYEELHRLGEVTRSHPNVDVVTVSTDPPALTDDAQRVLERFGLGDRERWIFTDPAERLRSEIDPDWYGDLPRSYLHDASHRRVAVVGLIPEETLERWVEEIFTAAPGPGVRERRPGPRPGPAGDEASGG